MLRIFALFVPFVSEQGSLPVKTTVELDLEFHG